MLIDSDELRMFMATTSITNPLLAIDEFVSRAERKLSAEVKAPFVPPFGWEPAPQWAKDAKETDQGTD